MVVPMVHYDMIEQSSLKILQFHWPQHYPTLGLLIHTFPWERGLIKAKTYLKNHMFSNYYNSGRDCPNYLMVPSPIKKINSILPALCMPGALFGLVLLGKETKDWKSSSMTCPTYSTLVRETGAPPPTRLSCQKISLITSMLAPTWWLACPRQPMV